MLNWSLLDLKGALTLLRADPASFSPEALDAMARLCDVNADAWENEFRWVLRTWPLRPQQMPYVPGWIQVDNDYPTGHVLCGTQEECAMLRAILHTAAQLRREGKLSELSALADAAHNFPAMITGGSRRALHDLREELRRIGRLYGVTLLPPPPPDRQSVLQQIKPEKYRTTGGSNP